MNIFRIIKYFILREFFPKYFYGKAMKALFYDESHLWPDKENEGYMLPMAIKRTIFVNYFNTFENMKEEVEV